MFIFVALSGFIGLIGARPVFHLLIIKRTGRVPYPMAFDFLLASVVIYTSQEEFAS